jgi:hypothetical protein
MADLQVVLSAIRLAPRDSLRRIHIALWSNGLSRGDFGSVTVGCEPIPPTRNLLPCFGKPI